LLLGTRAPSAIIAIGTRITCCDI